MKKRRIRRPGWPPAEYGGPAPPARLAQPLRPAAGRAVDQTGEALGFGVLDGIAQRQWLDASGPRRLRPAHVIEGVGNETLDGPAGKGRLRTLRCRLDGCTRHDLYHLAVLGSAQPLPAY